MALRPTPPGRGRLSNVADGTLRSGSGAWPTRHLAGRIDPYPYRWGCVAVRHSKLERLVALREVETLNVEEFEAAKDRIFNQ